MEFKIGTEKEIEILVTPNDSAKSYGSGLVDVFATPAMIALMEKTALQLAMPFLEEGMNTVGTEISVKHIKATALGKRVQSYAKLIEANGAKLVFEVEAYDEDGMIGKGIHKRYVINEEEFMKSLT